MQVTTADTGASVELSPVCFERDFNESLVHQSVVAFLAGQRQGTRAQKTRSDVSGGGAKPFRQKGTGRAARARSAARCGPVVARCSRRAIATSRRS